MNAACVRNLRPNRVAGIKLVVPPLLRNQLVVGAPLDDAALLQDRDTVRIPDCGQAVGNDEGGTPIH